MAAVDEEIELKLSNVFFIRTDAVTKFHEAHRVELLANLLYLYDESWNLEEDGVRVVVGSRQEDKLNPDPLKSATFKKVKKWLTLAELGHLVMGDSSIVETKKFLRLMTGLMDRLEHKLGMEGLRARVREVARKQARLNEKENIQSPSKLENKRLSSALQQSPLVLQNNISATSAVNTKDSSDNAYIPTGKQLPRTPPSVSSNSANTSSIISNGGNSPSSSRMSSFYSPNLSKVQSKVRRQDRARMKVSVSDFDISVPGTSTNSHTDSQVPHTIATTTTALSSSPGTRLSSLDNSPVQSGEKLLTSKVLPGKVTSDQVPVVERNEKDGELVRSQRERSHSSEVPQPLPPHNLDEVSSLPQLPVGITDTPSLSRAVTPPVPELIAKHIIPTGRQLPSTPQLQPNHQPLNSEPSGKYELPLELEKVAIPSQQELENMEKQRMIEEERSHMKASENVEREMILLKEAEKKRVVEAEFDRKRVEDIRKLQEEREKLEVEKQIIERMKNQLNEKAKLLDEKEKQLKEEERKFKEKSRKEAERLEMEERQLRDKKKHLENSLKTFETERHLWEREVFNSEEARKNASKCSEKNGIEDNTLVNKSSDNEKIMHTEMRAPSEESSEHKASQITQNNSIQSVKKDRLFDDEKISENLPEALTENSLIMEKARRQAKQGPPTERRTRRLVESSGMAVESSHLSSDSRDGRNEVSANRELTKKELMEAKIAKRKLRTEATIRRSEEARKAAQARREEDIESQRREMMKESAPTSEEAEEVNADSLSKSDRAEDKLSPDQKANNGNSKEDSKILVSEAIVHGPEDTQSVGLNNKQTEVDKELIKIKNKPIRIGRRTKVMKKAEEFEPEKVDLENAIEVENMQSDRNSRIDIENGADVEEGLGDESPLYPIHPKINGSKSKSRDPKLRAETLSQVDKKRKNGSLTAECQGGSPPKKGKTSQRNKSRKKPMGIIPEENFSAKDNDGNKDSKESNLKSVSLKHRKPSIQPPCLHEESSLQEKLERRREHIDQTILNPETAISASKILKNVKAVQEKTSLEKKLEKRFEIIEVPENPTPVKRIVQQSKGAIAEIRPDESNKSHQHDSAPSPEKLTKVNKKKSLKANIELPIVEDDSSLMAKLDKRRKKIEKPLDAESLTFTNKLPKKSTNVDKATTVSIIIDDQMTENLDDVTSKPAAKGKKSGKTLQVAKSKKDGRHSSEDQDYYTAAEESLHLPRPKRNCKKKLENLEGTCRSVSNTPSPGLAQDSRNPSLKEPNSEALDVPLNKNPGRKPRNSKKNWVEPDSKVDLAKVGQENALPEECTQQVGVKRNSRRIQEGKEESGPSISTENSTKSKARKPKPKVKGALSKVSDEVYHTPSTKVADEIYKTPQPLGSLSQVLDEEYKTPEETARRPRRRLKK